MKKQAGPFGWYPGKLLGRHRTQYGYGGSQVTYDPRFSNPPAQEQPSSTSHTPTTPAPTLTATPQASSRGISVGTGGSVPGGATRNVASPQGGPAPAASAPQTPVSNTGTPAAPKISPQTTAGNAPSGAPPTMHYTPSPNQAPGASRTGFVPNTNTNTARPGTSTPIPSSIDLNESEKQTYGPYQPNNQVITSNNMPTTQIRHSDEELASRLARENFTQQLTAPLGDGPERGSNPATASGPSATKPNLSAGTNPQEPYRDKFLRRLYAGWYDDPTAKGQRSMGELMGIFDRRIAEGSLSPQDAAILQNAYNGYMRDNYSRIFDNVLREKGMAYEMPQMNKYTFDPTAGVPGIQQQPTPSGASQNISPSSNQKPITPRPKNTATNVRRKGSYNGYTGNNVDALKHMLSLDGGDMYFGNANNDEYLLMAMKNYMNAHPEAREDDTVRGYYDRMYNESNR